jgi:hypothetical protein
MGVKTYVFESWIFNSPDLFKYGIYDIHILKAYKEIFIKTCTMCMKTNSN